MAAALLCLASCASSPISGSGRLKTADVPAAIAKAGAVAIDSASDKELAKVVGSMLKAARARGLTTDQRVAVQQLLEDSANELGTRGTDPGALEDLALVDLPARIAVPAGVRSATLMFEDNDRGDAVSLLRRVDQRYPSHALRQEVGSLLSEIGDSYANDKRRRFFLFPYRARATGVYEYLTTEYPTHPDSDDALVQLAETYERQRAYDVAIERHRDLVLWSRDSPFRPGSEAAIPRLRLADLDGPEYGRDSMLIALDELEQWVAKYGDHPLRPEVDRTRVDCLQRLADNDLIVAKFYRTVKSPDGAREHASRALEFATLAGNPGQLDEIRTFLEGVDEIERVDAPVVIRESSPQDIAGGRNGELSGPAELAPSTPGVPIGSVPPPDDGAGDEPAEPSTSDDLDVGDQQ